MTAQRQLLARLINQVARGVPCALCVVVGARGSTPQEPGAMLLVDAAGGTSGTIGGGCVEAEVRRHALRIIPSGRSELLKLVLDHDYGWDDGLICGGRLDVAVVVVASAAEAESVGKALEQIDRRQPASLPLRVEHEGRRLGFRVNIAPTPWLLVAGAGHVGAAVAKVAVGLDFRVVVFDDRADLLVPERLMRPIETVAGDISQSLRQWPIDANTYIVIVTRGHRHDEQALHAVLDSPARYIGMIGSRRKIRLIFDDLERMGVPRSKLEAVHTPIGLDIGAVTVPELAVSIAAELIQVRRAEKVQTVEGPFQLDIPAS
ncbi:MAG TPA: XdhC/CoxI family protein [Planctomycetaceae bacterium]|nr:XdhC/CoxI family protein [Planctomycetaceae bacterium]HIQ20406.1 XdhC/CoxI family protein [Planctomycetota bacterium]